LILILIISRPTAGMQCWAVLCDCGVRVWSGEVLGFVARLNLIMALILRVAMGTLLIILS